MLAGNCKCGMFDSKYSHHEYSLVWFAYVLLELRNNIFYLVTRQIIQALVLFNIFTMFGLV